MRRFKIHKTKWNSVNTRCKSKIYLLVIYYFPSLSNQSIHSFFPLTEHSLKVAEKMQERCNLVARRERLSLHPPSLSNQTKKFNLSLHPSLIKPCVCGVLWIKKKKKRDESVDLRSKVLSHGFVRECSCVLQTIEVNYGL